MSKESADAALGKFAEAVNTGKFRAVSTKLSLLTVSTTTRPTDRLLALTVIECSLLGLRTAFPDMNVTQRSLCRTRHHRVAYTLAGTHTGPLGKIPPSGRSVKSAECRSPNSKTARWSRVGDDPEYSAS